MKIKSIPTGLTGNWKYQVKGFDNIEIKIVKSCNVYFWSIFNNEYMAGCSAQYRGKESQKGIAMDKVKAYLTTCLNVPVID
ncbi:hypothetical protein [uncultured Arcobacter sp.]|mgnify:CR=1 FL=1|uniref:hypothetical protein n=1 Tax=uncultured Arcobacter sp. TaxID=165434 RepID=UPI00260C184D|nr:hypothetical protein [uncultured Arcobacter sp.]